MKMIRLFRKELAAEASVWAKEGLISTDQAEAIAHRYGTTLPTGDERSLGYYILLAFSAFFMGLAVIVLISANWEQIPRSVRMLSLIAMTALANGAGVLAVHRGRDAAGQIWLFLGSLFYGASIMLIAQIYHLGEHFPDGIFWWAMGIFPVALVTRSVPIMLWTALLSFLWMLVEANVGFFPSAYPLFVLGMFWFALKQSRSALIFLVASVGIIIWLELLLAWWMGGFYRFDDSTAHVVFTGCLFLVAHTLFKVLEQLNSAPLLMHYGFVARLWVIRAGLFAVLIFGFHEPWEELIEEAWDGTLALGMFVVAALLQIGMILWLVQRHTDRQPARQTILTFVSSIGFSGLFGVALTLVIRPIESVNHAATLLQVMTNLVAISVGIWMIVRAVQDTLTHYFYTGILMLILTALFRYFDLVGDYIGGAALFFVCALLLFGAARMWRHRLAQSGEV